MIEILIKLSNHYTHTHTHTHTHTFVYTHVHMCSAKLIYSFEK